MVELSGQVRGITILSRVPHLGTKMSVQNALSIHPTVNETCRLDHQIDTLTFPTPESCP